MVGIVRRYKRSLNWPLRYWHFGVWRGHPDQCPRPWRTIIIGPLWVHVFKWTTSV